MDQFMVDLTEVNDAQTGDLVSIDRQFGRRRNYCRDIGHWAGTISYDVLSGQRPRASAVHQKNGEPIGGRLGMTMAVDLSGPADEFRRPCSVPRLWFVLVLVQQIFLRRYGLWRMGWDSDPRDGMPPPTAFQCRARRPDSATHPANAPNHFLSSGAEHSIVH